MVWLLTMKVVLSHHFHQRSESNLINYLWKALVRENWISFVLGYRGLGRFYSLKRSKNRIYLSSNFVQNITWSVNFIHIWMVNKHDNSFIKTYLQMVNGYIRTLHRHLILRQLQRKCWVFSLKENLFSLTSWHLCSKTKIQFALFQEWSSLHNSSAGSKNLLSGKTLVNVLRNHYFRLFHFCYIFQFI